MIRFSCPNCKAAYEVDNAMAGRSVDCSQCGRPLTIPSYGDEGGIRAGTPDPKLPSYDEGDDLDDAIADIQRRKRDPWHASSPVVVDSDLEMTPVDWVLCIFCSGIGCLVGLYLLSQGKPKAGKMVVMAILFSVLWNMLFLAIQSGMR